MKSNKSDSLFKTRLAGFLFELFVCLCLFSTPGYSKSLEDAFNTKFRIIQGGEAALYFELCFVGEGEKEIAEPNSSDLKATSGGKWHIVTRPERVVITGTGSFGSQVMKKGDCMRGQHDLKDLFDTVSVGKNTVSLELTVRNLTDNTVLTLRKIVELELTADQVKSLSK